MEQKSHDHKLRLMETSLRIPPPPKKYLAGGGQFELPSKYTLLRKPSVRFYPYKKADKIKWFRFGIKLTTSIPVPPYLAASTSDDKLWAHFVISGVPKDHNSYVLS